MAVLAPPRRHRHRYCGLFRRPNLRRSEILAADQPQQDVVRHNGRLGGSRPRRRGISGLYGGRPFRDPPVHAAVVFRPDGRHRRKRPETLRGRQGRLRSPAWPRRAFRPVRRGARRERVHAARRRVHGRAGARLMRRVTIFGATGSIGCQTVELIARDPDAYEVVALTGGENVAKLAEQVILLRAEIAITAEDRLLPDLRARLAGTGIAAAAGRAALLEAAAMPADWVMSSIVGAAGLAPGLLALAHGSTLALANKESLVTAGPLLMGTAREHGATVLPVDSEHSAVFQALVGEDIASVERIVITASGGAFRDWPAERLAHATPDEAAWHPNWDMGQRITIDSASLFNKALELIETHEYFGIAPRRIEALLPPESLVHALVGFTDGALMAHVGPPDMRHAIGYALNWPERKPLPVERLDLAKIGQLTFRAPDEARYPALRLAREVMEAGGLAGAVFNGAKETALDAFLARQIRFTDMAAVVEEVLERMARDNALKCDALSLDAVTAADHLARTRAAEAAAALATTA